MHKRQEEFFAFEGTIPALLVILGPEDLLSPSVINNKLHFVYEIAAKPEHIIVSVIIREKAFGRKTSVSSHFAFLTVTVA